MEKRPRSPARHFTAIGLVVLTLGAVSAGIALATQGGQSAGGSTIRTATLSDATTTTPATGGRPAPIIHRPANLGFGQKVPLLIALHGGGGTPAGMERLTEFDRVANQHGFVVAYLGSAPPIWKDPSNIGYISSMIDQLTASENIDPNRVYVTGFSLGGYATFRSGCQLSKKVAGIAAVGQAMAPTWRKPCNISRPVTELSIVGSNDGVPVHQSSSSPISADQTAARWRKLDACSSARKTMIVSPTVQTSWSNCIDGSAVGEYVVQGGVHAWPQLNAPQNQTTPDYRYDASAAIWAFLSTHTAPPLTPTANLSGVAVKQAGRNRTVIAKFKLGEPIIVKVTLLRGGRRVVAKNFVFRTGPRARLSLQVAANAAAGAATSEFVVADSYGRRAKFSRHIYLP